MDRKRREEGAGEKDGNRMLVVCQAALEMTRSTVMFRRQQRRVRFIGVEVKQFHYRPQLGTFDNLIHIIFIMTMNKLASRDWTHLADPNQMSLCKAQRVCWRCWKRRRLPFGLVCRVPLHEDAHDLARRWKLERKLQSNQSTGEAKHHIDAMHVVERLSFGQQAISPLSQQHLAR